MNAVARCWRAALSGLTFAIPLRTSAISAASEPVDVELVIAVDTSSSMKTVELQLQRQGYAAAFRSREVIDASTGSRRVIDISGDGPNKQGAPAEPGDARIWKVSNGEADCTIGEALWRGWRQDDDGT